MMCAYYYEACTAVGILDWLKFDEKKYVDWLKHAEKKVGWLKLAEKKPLTSFINGQVVPQ